MPIINHYYYYAYRVPANNQLRKQSSKFLMRRKNQRKIKRIQC